jgi:hypothetical protein
MPAKPKRLSHWLVVCSSVCVLYRKLALQRGFTEARRFGERSSLLPFADCLFVWPAPLGWRNTPARDDVFGALPASVAADGETHAGDCTAAAARHVDELAMFRAWSRVDDGANAVSPNRPDGLFL